MKGKLKSGRKNYQAKKSLERWSLSRKVFLKTLTAGGVLSQIPFTGMVAQKDKTRTKILSTKQSAIIESAQEILFPDDGNGPGAKGIHAKNYLEWVITDKEKDPDEVKYIIDGIGWVDQTSKETYSKPYMELSSLEKEILIDKISNEGWGESWLSVILTLIFEALFCDPQYGGNPESVGWNWLSHNPGQPRPVKDLLYPEILQTTG